MSIIDEYDGWRDETPDRKPLSLEDVGTAYEHIAYVHSLWSEALRMISRTNPTSKMAKEGLRDLQGAVKLIEKQMEVMADYSRKRWDLAKQIDDIPKDPTKIVGGRGTGDRKLLKGFFS